MVLPSSFDRRRDDDGDPASSVAIACGGNSDVHRRGICRCHALRSPTATVVPALRVVGRLSGSLDVFSSAADRLGG